MHINTAGGDAARFANRYPAHTHTHTHTHTSAPCPDGRAVRGAEAVVSQVQAAVVAGAGCHTSWAAPPLPLGAAHKPSPGPGT